MEKQIQEKSRLQSNDKFYVEISTTIKERDWNGKWIEVWIFDHELTAKIFLEDCKGYEKINEQIVREITLEEFEQLMQEGKIDKIREKYGTMYTIDVYQDYCMKHEISFQELFNRKGKLL